MTTLAKKFVWYLEHKTEISGLRNYVREVERELPGVIFQWATNNVRQSILTFPATPDMDFGDLAVDIWPTASIWWFKRSQYDNHQGRGAYLHLWIPDGIDWLKEGSEDAVYIGFALKYGEQTADRADLIRQRARGRLPAEVSEVTETDDDGTLQVYTYRLPHIFTASKLAKSDRAAHEFDEAIKAFTIPVLRAVP